MSQAKDVTFIAAPREGVNDDVVRVVSWLVTEGSQVQSGQALAVLETTKATFDLEAPRAGYVFQMAAAGTEVAVGAPVAAIGNEQKRPSLEATRPAEMKASTVGVEPVLTEKARELMRQHGLTAADFVGLPTIKTSDVQALLDRRTAALIPVAAAENVDWDAMIDTPARRELSDTIGLLRRRMRGKFNRHVPTGDLLSDRWELAKSYGFGEGTSVYDDCLILGDVKVGKHCWVGPFTILDGQGGLTIGDYVDIGAGAHVYSHNTIDRALSGHNAPIFKKPTRIGSRCFIAPQSIIGPGTVIGDCCFVAAGSYVEGVFPDHSYIAGTPARVSGTVDVDSSMGRVRIRPVKSKAD